MFAHSSLGIQVEIWTLNSHVIFGEYWEITVKHMLDKVNAESARPSSSCCSVPKWEISTEKNGQDIIGH